ncbi:hypothetical protein [Streptomyces tanashiensis]|uniref:hypothetical protein n=1 Tax=Streptomyces tanashiensis TaxID=67367 RepID=UPI0034168140
MGTAGYPLDHATLDLHGTGRGVQHLRGVLVTAGALPERDGQLHALVRAIVSLISDVREPDDRFEATVLVAAIGEWL